jgi:hypothetical protein
MWQSSFDRIITQVLDLGITIQMHRDTDGVIWYNLNTGMKSELEIALIHDVSGRTGHCHVRGRYNHTAIIRSFDELLLEVKNCMHGRTFGTHAWLQCLEDNKLL